jgi:hypothetical protein
VQVELAYSFFLLRFGTSFNLVARSRHLKSVYELRGKPLVWLTVKSVRCFRLLGYIGASVSSDLSGVKNEGEEANSNVTIWGFGFAT